MINPTDIARFITEDPDIPDEYAGLEDNDEFETEDDQNVHCAGCGYNEHINTATHMLCRCGTAWCSDCSAELFSCPHTSLQDTAARINMFCGSDISQCPMCADQANQ